MREFCWKYYNFHCHSQKPASPRVIVTHNGRRKILAITIVWAAINVAHQLRRWGTDLRPPPAPAWDICYGVRTKRIGPRWCSWKNNSIRCKLSMAGIRIFVDDFHISVCSQIRSIWIFVSSSHINLDKAHRRSFALILISTHGMQFCTLSTLTVRFSHFWSTIPYLIQLATPVIDRT